MKKRIEKTKNIWAIITKSGEMAYCGLLKEDMPKPNKGKYIRCKIIYNLDKLIPKT